MAKSLGTKGRAADAAPLVWREKSENSVSSCQSKRRFFQSSFSETATSHFDNAHRSVSSDDSFFRKTLLPDAESMKEKMRREMCKPKYNVSTYYHKTGFSQWIARQRRFEQVTLIVIALNALWIWIDTDHNPASILLNSPPVFQMVENSFCIYFAFEWSLRFGAFEKKRNGLRDAWFVFDSLLVVTMVFETWVMTAILIFMNNGESQSIVMSSTGLLRMARLLRLTRMARMARLLRATPELLILVKGLVAAMRSVWLTVGLLFVMLYIFGIAFVQLCNDSPCETFFPDVPGAMHELLLNAALMDGLSNLVKPLKEQSLILLFILYAFVFLSAFLLMNMLIGVICEVVSAVAVTEREALSLTFVRDKIHKLVCETGADQNNDQEIFKEEFMQLLVNPKCIAILEDVGVDVVGLMDFQDTLFEDDAYNAKMEGDDEDDDAAEKKLTISDLMGLILALRGSNSATVRDIVNLRKSIEGRFSAVEQKFAWSSRSQAISGSPQVAAALATPTILLHGTCQSIPEEKDKKTTSDSMSPCSSARLGSSRGFQDMFHSLQGMMSAHELQVAVLESENRQLKEEVAQMARDACRSSLSKARVACKELDASPDMTTVIPPNIVQTPNEPTPKFWTELSLSTVAPRMAAERSVAHSVRQEADAGTEAMDVDSAAGNSSAFLSPGSQRLVPKRRKEACTATRNVASSAG